MANTAAQHSLTAFDQLINPFVKGLEYKVVILIDRYIAYLFAYSTDDRWEDALKVAMVATRTVLIGFVLAYLYHRGNNMEFFAALDIGLILVPSYIIYQLIKTYSGMDYWFVYGYSAITFLLVSVLTDYFPDQYKKRSPLANSAEIARFSAFSVLLAFCVIIAVEMSIEVALGRLGFFVMAFGFVAAGIGAGVVYATSQFRGFLIFMSATIAILYFGCALIFYLANHERGGFFLVCGLMFVSAMLDYLIVPKLYALLGEKYIPVVERRVAN